MGYKRFTPVEKLINKVFSKKQMISEEKMEEKIRSFSKPTLSYFMLLTASIIIATLGLLMNASAIVIGSMIISPLTWPMFGLADGAALGNRRRIKANLLILVASVAYGVVLAYILTVFSPLKVVNSEILARSQPTLLDAIVAITAGGIGILAIVRKNIADSVAGVAVALSLTPPLCVVGISLALSENELVTGSALLLLTNALSITLVAGVTLILVHYSWRRKLRMAPRAFIVMTVSLLITAFPLYQLLNKYSFETSSYGVVLERLENFVADVSPSGSVQNLYTSLEDKEGQDTYVITADVFLPPNANITYQSKDQLIGSLENELGKLVDLELRVQNVSLLANESDLVLRDQIEGIQNSFLKHMAELNQSLTIGDIQVQKSGEVWQLNSQLSGSLTSAPSEPDIKQVETLIEEDVSQDIQLAVSFLPIVEIKTAQQTVADGLRDSLEDFLGESQPQASLVDLKISQTGSEGQLRSVITLEIKLPQDAQLEDEVINQLKAISENKLNSAVELRLQSFSFQQVIL